MSIFIYTINTIYVTCNFHAIFINMYFRKIYLWLFQI